MSISHLAVTIDASISDPVNGRPDIPAETPVVMPTFALKRLAPVWRAGGARLLRVSRIGYYTRPFYWHGQSLNGEAIMAHRGAGIGDQMIVAGVLAAIRRRWLAAGLYMVCDPHVARNLWAGAEGLPFTVLQQPVRLDHWRKAAHWLVEGYCDGNFEPDQPDAWDGHLGAIGLLDEIGPDGRRVYVPTSRAWTERARAWLANVSDGRGTRVAPTRCALSSPCSAGSLGDSLCRAPQEGGVRQTRPGTAASPDAAIADPAVAGCRTANAAEADAGREPLASPPASGVGRSHEGSGESATPRPPEASGAPILLWHLAASTPMRSLTPAQTVSTLRGIREQMPDVGIILTGSEDQYEVYAEALDVPGILGTTRGLKLQEVFAVVGMVDAVVAPDSCLGHVAAAYDVPCVSYWCPFPWRSRATHYTRHIHVEPDCLPPCAPCWSHETTGGPDQRGCPLAEAGAEKWCKGLAAIRPQALVEAVGQALAGRKGR